MSPLLDAATSTDPSPLTEHMAGLVIPDPLLAIPDMDDDDDDDLDLKCDSQLEDKEVESCDSSRRASSKSHTGSTRKRNCEGDSLTKDITSPTGDDSDYYTPEDPGTTILSPLQDQKVGFITIER